MRNLFDDAEPMWVKPSTTSGDSLPCNEQAEMGLLCAAINNKMVFWGLREMIDEDLFYISENRILWEAIDVLHGKAAQVDPITIAREIEKKHGKNAVSSKYINECFNFLPSYDNWKTYLKICDEQKYKRRLYIAGQRMMAQALEAGKNPQQIRSQAEKVLEQIVDRKDPIVSISDAVQARMMDWDNAISTKGDSAKGLLTGIPSWDKATRGCRGKTLHVIVGDSKAGKTTLALQMALHPAIVQKKPILFCSLEMSVESLVDKMVCGEARVSMNKLFNGELSPRDAKNLVAAALKVSDSPIYIWPGSLLTPTKFRALANRAKQEYDIQMVVVDYYQLMEGDDNRKNREQQLGEIGRALRATAMELNIPIIVIAQLNDDGKLRESRSLKMHADSLTKITKQKNRHILEIVYNRDGKTDKIPCIFYSEHGRFEEVEEEEEKEKD